MNEGSFDALVVVPKSGTEPFHASGSPAGTDLLQFWRWASSDLVSNAMRGVLAEYIVGLALNCVAGTRVEWDACDLVTVQGTKVEVKSAAYVQSWKQKGPSTISFSITPTTGWDAATNTSSAERRRQADVYVFCLLAHPDKATIDPLDLDQWKFYALSTAQLDATVGGQKTISLGALLRLHPEVGTFADIADLVQIANSAVTAAPKA
jgi:hypothetical protein